MKKTFSSSAGFNITRSTFFITAGLILALLAIALNGLYIPGFIEIKGISEVRPGIDINGGTEATLKAADSYQGTVTGAQLEAAKSVVELRLDNQNITDREVYIDEYAKRIIVRWPSKDRQDEDPRAVLKELGEMALLTFKDPNGEVVIDGSHVSQAYPTINTQTQRPVVVLVLNAEGKTKFAEATQRWLGQNISINMDDIQLSNPEVEEVIPDGEATISGMASTDEAKELASKIEAGALPFALEVIASNTISPILGVQALDVMKYAGIVAFILICLFMLLYYRLPGFVAILAISGQTAGQFLALSAPKDPLTLTLPGIAAIILSIGMGVDANIIIAERIKEELRNGNPLKIAVRNGFQRALAPVVDGNITCAIAAVILMILGSGAFISFGYLLLIGVILNVVFGVGATRLLTGSLSQYSKLADIWLYGGKKVQE
jgi:preprotein translocase subunit SecD